MLITIVAAVLGGSCTPSKTPPTPDANCKACPRSCPPRPCLVQASCGAGWETTKVVVAAKNIAAGTILSADMLTTDEIPRKYRSASMVIPAELKVVLGNKVRIPVETGDFLSWHYLRGKD